MANKSAVDAALIGHLGLVFRHPIAARRLGGVKRPVGAFNEAVRPGAQGSGSRAGNAVATPALIVTCAATDDAACGMLRSRTVWHSRRANTEASPLSMP